MVAALKGLGFLSPNDMGERWPRSGRSGGQALPYAIALPAGKLAALAPALNLLAESSRNLSPNCALLRKLDRKLRALVAILRCGEVCGRPEIIR
ncbi:hypothetical protein MESS2_1250047 [Mesorhizobium metallidurans STM 2683]|uniref:Uncharacterized protein n=1 Tax=Mesorhizobium metallidurans STM 2683 TaxID=1297569 RepID=M5EIT6_9HYPH|nr:hypothetical protein MESS2_1250047 [Mesorhizobium metallidurans STM 2683]